MIDSSHVAAAHNQMASEYDHLDDLWYSWLFAQLHEFIAEHLPAPGAAHRVAVDAGCGTGFQSFLLARAGYEVIGFDLAEELVGVARAKAPAQAAPPLEAPPLFSAKHAAPGDARHHARLAGQLERLRAGRLVQPPRFEVADLRTFDFGLHRPSVITCCGSVLSFVDEYAEAVARMASGLAAGGYLFLEVEQKANPDLLWPLADSLMGGRLGYEQPLRVSLRNAFGRAGRSVQIDYPFELADGTELILPIWLFSVRDLERAFARAGLAIRHRTAIHQFTNLIPSTILHQPNPSASVRNIFAALGRLDRWLASAWPFRRLGCSAVYCLQKTR